MFNIDSFGLTLMSNLIANAPVRTKPPAGPHGKSPYPGNLRQNGINMSYIRANHIKITIGGEPAPYGPYTETRSHKPFWILRSCIDTANQYILKYDGWGEVIDEGGKD